MLEGSPKKQVIGQAAIELAVFGAIVIFVLGMIIRTSVSTSFAQSESLKAMRFAMLQSLKTSQAGSTSRNSASVIFIEDRLSPDFNKFGPSDRSMFLAQGSGTFSNLLFYPVDFNEVQYNLPTSDIYINGVHLGLTSAGMRDIAHVPPYRIGSTTERYKRSYCADLSNCPPAPVGIGTTRPIGIGTTTPIGIGTTTPPIPDPRDGVVPDPRGDGSFRYKGWNFKCIEGRTTVIYPSGQYSFIGFQPNGQQVDLVNQPPPSAPHAYRGQPPPSPVGGQYTQDSGVWYGCQMYYYLVPNTPENRTSGKFCTSDASCGDGGLLTANERFDLNRNDDFTDDPKNGTSTKVPREFISWQWGAVNGIYANVKLASGNSDAGPFPSYDVNNDGQEETVYWSKAANTLLLYNGSGIPQINPLANNPDDALYAVYGVFAGVRALDAKAGDINSFQNEHTQGTTGLLNDMSIYTRPRNATDASGSYLELRDGKLFAPGTNTVVRSMNRRDMVDVIERRVRLSSNSGRFCISSRCSNPNQTVETCTGTIVPVVPPIRPACVADQGSAGHCQIEDNPVEVCTASNLNPSSNEVSNDCFLNTPGMRNVTKTCMDVSTNIIYVRSRLANQQGHRWVTDASGLNKNSNVGIGTTRWGELGIK